MKGNQITKMSIKTLFNSS